MGSGQGRAIQIAKGAADNTMRSHDRPKANREGPERRQTGSAQIYFGYAKNTEKKCVQAKYWRLVRPLCHIMELYKVVFYVHETTFSENMYRFACMEWLVVKTRMSDFP